MKSQSSPGNHSPPVVYHSHQVKQAEVTEINWQYALAKPYNIITHITQL